MDNIARLNQISRFHRQTLVVARHAESQGVHFQQVHLGVVLDEERRLMLNPQVRLVLPKDSANEPLKGRLGKRGACLDLFRLALTVLDILGRQDDLVGPHARVDVVDRDGRFPVVVGVYRHAPQKFFQIGKEDHPGFLVGQPTKTDDSCTLRQPNERRFRNPHERVHFFFLNKR